MKIRDLNRNHKIKFRHSQIIAPSFVPLALYYSLRLSFPANKLAGYIHVVPSGLQTVRSFGAMMNCTNPVSHPGL